MEEVNAGAVTPAPREGSTRSFEHPALDPDTGIALLIPVPGFR